MDNISDYFWAGVYAAAGVLGFIGTIVLVILAIATPMFLIAWGVVYISERRARRRGGST